VADGALRVLLRTYRVLPTGLRRFVVRLITPSFTVGAVCVVERHDGRVLFVRHSYRHRWGLPGGVLQRGEEADDAAARECMEEVGLDIDVVAEPAVVIAPKPRRVDVIFRCRPAVERGLDELVPCSPEIVEVRWFEPDALPELQHEVAQAMVALARADGARLPSSHP
jgi:8-oxo-dGTP diphosphatase